MDVSYGGENGFNQAIELAGETLGSVKLIQVGAWLFCLCGRMGLDERGECVGVGFRTMSHGACVFAHPPIPPHTDPAYHVLP